MPVVSVVLYATSIATTLKVRSDISRLRQLLESLQVAHEEVDLTLTPERRTEMLAASDGVTALPQLHVNGKFVGSTDALLELHDHGDLLPLLRGE